MSTDSKRIALDVIDWMWGTGWAEFLEAARDPATANFVGLAEISSYQEARSPSRSASFRIGSAAGRCN